MRFPDMALSQLSSEIRFREQTSKTVAQTCIYRESRAETTHTRCRCRPPLHSQAGCAPWAPSDPATLRKAHSGSTQSHQGRSKDDGSPRKPLVAPRSMGSYNPVLSKHSTLHPDHVAAWVLSASPQPKGTDVSHCIPNPLPKT